MKIVPCKRRSLASPQFRQPANEWNDDNNNKIRKKNEFSEQAAASIARHTRCKH